MPVFSNSSGQPSRWFAQRNFPPYTYVPGQRGPHPTRHVDGHHFGHEPSPPANWAEERWAECDVYTWGIDLWNHGYYWEAHEQWEAVWKGIPRSQWDATLMSALIKLAAAGVKVREARLNGVRRHLSRAVVLLGQADRLRRTIRTQQRSELNEGLHESTYLGMDLHQLTAGAQACLEAAFLAVNPAEPFPGLVDRLPATLGPNEPWPVFPRPLPVRGPSSGDQQL